MLKILPEGSYPDIELEYLIVYTYNNGLYYRSIRKYVIAEKWISKAITLLNNYPIRSLFESDIMIAYDDIVKQLSSTQPPCLPTTLCNPKLSSQHLQATVFNCCHDEVKHI